MHERIGPFQIERELGRGGMGEVYLARDTRLDRQVAIKALPSHLAADPDRLARFQREAKVLASLNHPGIGAIHGLEEAAGHRYLILEFVDGETLADRLSRGAIPVDEALAIARQIAEALEVAHEKGIVHRDLKPGNVMVTDDGMVKVLDFGLARTGDEPPSSRSGTGGFHPESPTVTSPAMPMNSPTIAGAILGTAGYMSPEQARGRAVDKRSDIFSFGCVLYEMLTGSRPFVGETVTDSLGATLHKEANLLLLPAGTPIRLRELLTLCLAKDRKQRLHDIADARLALQRLAEGHDLERPHDANTRRAGPNGSILAAAAFIGGTLMLGAGWMLASRFAARPVVAAPVFATISPAPSTTIVSEGDIAGPAAISPDGRLIAFRAADEAGGKMIWMRSLGATEPEPLKGTEGGTFPFWSPDGGSIGFFADGRLRRIDLSTRSVRTLCDAPGGRGGAWFDSGDIVFTPSFQAGLFRIPASGGEPTPVTTVDKSRFSSHRWPQAIDGTGLFTYLGVNHDPSKQEETGVFLAALDGSMNRELINTPFGAQIVGDRLLFIREGTLLTVLVDKATGTLRGEPVPLISDVLSDSSTWHAGFSASRSGALVYHSTSKEPDGDATAESKAASIQPQAGLGENVRTTLVSRAGRGSAVIADGMLQNAIALSPDGLNLALSGRWPNETGPASYDIWIFGLFGEGSDVAASKFEAVPPGSQPRRFTFMHGDEVAPCWSPDGKQIAFGKIFGTEPLGVFIKPLDGGPERLLLKADAKGPPVYPTNWTPDGRFIICRRGNYVATSPGDVIAVPQTGGAPIDLIADGQDNGSGVVSNDGKWLAFDVGSVGSSEVFVMPFAAGWEADRAAGRPVPDPGERYRVSIAGGARPVWGRGGKTLYYASTSNSIVGVTWSTDFTRFTHDAGQAFIDFPLRPSANFDVMPGEQTFALSATISRRDSTLRLVLNWRSLLKN